MISLQSYTLIVTLLHWKYPAAVFLTTVLVLASTLWIYDRLNFVHIQDARVSTDLINMSSQVAGVLLEFPISKGQYVAAGSVLAQLDDRQAKLMLEQLHHERTEIIALIGAAEKELLLITITAEAELQQQQSRLDEMQATKDKNASILKFARKRLERSQMLASQFAASSHDEDNDLDRVEQAKADQIIAHSRWASEQARLHQIEAQSHNIEVAQAKLAALQADHERLNASITAQQLTVEQHRILSPIDGVIDAKFANPGEYLFPGQRLVALHDSNNIWISANIKETALRHIQPGSQALVQIDAYPDLQLTGQVSRISTAFNNQFALLPSSNLSGNFTKVTQRTEVRIDLTQNADKTPAAAQNFLYPGMMVTLKIAAGDPSN